MPTGKPIRLVGRLERSLWGDDDFGRFQLDDAAVIAVHLAGVKPIATTDYPTPAQRPANSLLSHDAIRTAYGIEPRAWQDALSEILDELIGAPK